MSRVLQPEDRASATWMRIREHLEKRLVQLREKNDKTMPDYETENLRGRIAEVKALISLGNDEVEIIE